MQLRVVLSEIFRTLGYPAFLSLQLGCAVGQFPVFSLDRIQLPQQERLLGLFALEDRRDLGLRGGIFLPEQLALCYGLVQLCLQALLGFRSDREGGTLCGLFCPARELNAQP